MPLVYLKTQPVELGISAPHPQRMGCRRARARVWFGPGEPWTSVTSCLYCFSENKAPGLSLTTYHPLHFLLFSYLSLPHTLPRTLGQTPLKILSSYNTSHGSTVKRSIHCFTSSHLDLEPWRHLTSQTYDPFTSDPSSCLTSNVHQHFSRFILCLHLSFNFFQCATLSLRMYHLIFT